MCFLEYLGKFFLSYNKFFWGKARKFAISVFIRRIFYGKIGNRRKTTGMKNKQEEELQRIEKLNE
jgi:hypothetical protein